MTFHQKTIVYSYKVFNLIIVFPDQIKATTVLLNSVSHVRTVHCNSPNTVTHDFHRPQRIKIELLPRQVHLTMGSSTKIKIGNVSFK